MGRDDHFISRLERLSEREAAVALEVHRTNGLVATLLRRGGVGAEHARVAIALTARPHGPRLIAARDGQLITCLAEGMANGPWPIVSRAALDAVRAERATELFGSDPSRALVASELVNAVPGEGAPPEAYVQLAREAPSLIESVLAGARRRWDAIVRALSARPAAASIPRGSDVELWCAAGTVLRVTAALSAADPFRDGARRSSERRYALAEVTAWARSEAESERAAREALAAPSLNRSCPCGSDRRFKRCCAALESSAA